MEWECCWDREEITPGDCPNIGEGEEELLTFFKRRVVEKCIDCPRFRNDLEKLQGSGHPLATLLPCIVGEFREQKAELQSMVGFVDSRNRELKFLHEISIVLQTSVELDEVLSVAMTAITAGTGFGMNRAFLLLSDKERKNLRGYLGVGPRDYDEAWRIWDEIGSDNQTLKEMARNFQKTKLSSERDKFHHMLEQLTVPLADQRHLLVRTLRQRKPVLVENAYNNPDVEPELARVLGVESFLITPLISRNRRIGIIISDNCITRKPITLQDMQSMEIFAFPVAYAIERASLYKRLQEELEKSKTANVKLKEQQERIVKMERMALVGRITSTIAHSIRNPLMVIGGFARSLLKKSADNDPKREYLESIVREAKQLESVLEEVLNYSDSLYPSMDAWDVNQLVTTVCRELAGRGDEEREVCQLDLAADIPPARIDYKQVAYCVRTILGAAIETLPETELVQVTTRFEGDEISLVIIDPAMVVSKETLAGMETPFATTQTLGSGVGISICKTILDKSGNCFEIENLSPIGTKYTIRLPVAREEVVNG